jgi:hypothetical protein
MRICSNPALLLLTVFAVLSFAATAPPAPTSEAPATPREVYNIGTQKLLAGKLKEAEALLESVLANQDENLQPPALFNLGHIRFREGAEELKKGPSEAPVAARGAAATLQGDEAIRLAEEALASDDIDKMVSAYLHGRGVRKELKGATEAVRQAMEAFGKVLTKWERASGDFKSAFELRTKDQDARHNGDVMDQYIAKLVDSIQRMQQAAMAQGAKSEKLGNKLKELKGKIPAPRMPPGAAGDDDEDEEKPLGQQPEQKEGPSRDGKEMTLTPEQAGWLLESFKLDKDRRLPMGNGAQDKPRDPNRPTW